MSSPPQQVVRRRGRKPARMRGWLAIGLAGVLTSCGTTGGVTEQERLADRVNAHLSPDVEAIQQEVYSFYDSWAGGSTGNQAGEVLLSYATNGAYSECMTYRGYDVPWQRSITAVTELDALNATGWLRQPMRPRFSHIAVGYALNARFDESYEDDFTPGQDAAIDDCIEQTEDRRVSDRDARRLTYPRGLDRLLEAWDRRVVAAATPVTGTRQAYNACVADHDLPGHPGASADAEEILTVMTEAMLDLAPSAESVPLGDEPPSPAWTEYLAIEDDVLAAEWQCAASVYADGMQALSGVVKEFTRDFGPEIHELARHWDTVRSDARQLGWSPQTPLASLTPV